MDSEIRPEKEFTPPLQIGTVTTCCFSQKICHMRERLEISTWVVMK